MSFEEFKDAGGSAARNVSSPGSRSSTRGGATESDGFRDFMHLRTLANKSGGRGDEKEEALAFNRDGVFSGMLASGEKTFTPLICEDVAEKLWNDSERTGRKPNYNERHSTIVGFSSAFIDKSGGGMDDGEGGDVDRYLEQRGDRKSRREKGGGEGEDWDFEGDETEEEEADGEEKKDSDRGIGQVKFGTKTTQPRANMLKKSKRSLSKGEDKGQVVKGAQLLQRR